MHETYIKLWTNKKYFIIPHWASMMRKIMPSYTPNIDFKWIIMVMVIINKCFHSWDSTNNSWQLYIPYYDPDTLIITFYISFNLYSILWGRCYYLFPFYRWCTKSNWHMPTSQILVKPRESQYLSMMHLSNYVMMYVQSNSEAVL